MSKRELNNICRFPSLLGGKLSFSNRVNNIKINDKKEIIKDYNNDFKDNKFFFSGNNVVLEKSREISTFDILLLLQIIETHQKYKDNSLLVTNENYEHTYDENDKKKFLDEIKKYCEGEGKNEYRAVSSNERKRKEYLADLLQKKVDESNYNEYKMYADSEESYLIDIDVSVLLKARGLRNQIENRMIIESSLNNLFNTSLTYYFLNDSLVQKIKDIKKNKQYKDWKFEVKEYFIKNRFKSKRFYRHIIEHMKMSEDLKTLKVRINKGFLDFCDSSKLFNFEKLTRLKSHSAKAFYINSCFSYKEKLTKEYIYELMDLNSDREDNNLSKAKKAIDELKSVNFLSDESCYDKANKMFIIKFTDEEIKKQGLVQQKKYSYKKGKSK